MTSVTGFLAETPDGTNVPADAHGNNCAFRCPLCGAPVLAVMLPHQRGSQLEKPTSCRSCDARFWLEVDQGSKRLIVHQVRDNHTGRYVLDREPNSTAEQNVASWGVISAIVKAYGGAEYEVLVAAVSQHNHPDGGRGFVDYCIRHGWLKPA